MNVAIIGTGNMAKGLGTRIIEGGHSITFYIRTPENAQALVDELQGKLKEGATVETRNAGDDLNGDIIIPAVPYIEVKSVIERYKDQLADKIYVDITNPIDLQTNEMIPPITSSGAEEIATLLPEGCKIVKAFNTTFAGTLESGEVDGKKLDVFVAGDDEEAKNKIKELIEGGGMRAIDVGPLNKSHLLEEAQLLHINLQQILGTNWMSTIKILP